MLTISCRSSAVPGWFSADFAANVDEVMIYGDELGGRISIISPWPTAVCGEWLTWLMGGQAPVDGTPFAGIFPHPIICGDIV